MSAKTMLKKLHKRKVARCMYNKYSCSAVPLPSYLYCEKHILEDKTVPFKQCSYTYAVNGEKCTHAVLNTSHANSGQSTLCKEHHEEYEATRRKPKSKILPPLSTADTILYGLSHYVKSSPYYKKHHLVGATADEFLEQLEKSKNVAVNPFTDIDPAEINAKTNETLNYSCEVDSDIEAATVDNVWDNGEQDSSDTESLDFEMTDPLRHSGVYTEEEMVLAIRNRALRLQNLCIQQYRRLLYILREKKSKYLAELKREKGIYGPLQKPRQMTLHEKRQYDKLKALSKYKKISTGPEALLFKKMLHRRKAVTPGMIVRPRNYNKCAFTEGVVKCALRAIPKTKYCRKHILNDHKQVLFQECGVQKKDHVCKEPIVPIPNVTCTFHHTVLLNPEPEPEPEPVSSDMEELKVEEITQSISSDQTVPNLDD